MEKVINMKKVIVNENERGFLFSDGKFVKVLKAGKYYTYGNRMIEVVSVNSPVSSAHCSLNTLLASEELKEEAAIVEVGGVGKQEIALHFVNGEFSGVLRNGTYAYWNIADKHEFRIVDISSPEVSDDIPQEILKKALSTVSVFHRIEVLPYQKVILYFDHKFERLLEPGVYYFWKNNTDVTVDYVDTRLKQLNIQGQEIMTMDKVSLRINFVCKYKITDHVKIMTEIDNYIEQIHIAAQFAIRDYVGKYKLDEVLSNKDELSEFVLKRLKAKEQELYVEFSEAGVKDIILPGEIRDIMNTVLMAEKKAQASVITRREEVASTRSLLNTAKLMDENATLYKLKELEYIERICENVGSINLNGSSDVVSQLALLLRGKTAKQ